MTSQTNPVIRIFAGQIYYGYKTIQDVPAVYRDRVTALLATDKYKEPYINKHRHTMETVDGLPEIAEQLSEQNQQTKLLSNGLQVVESNQASSLNVEIQGRTLTSLGNSNLESGKYYVVADKKTKIGVDNAVVNGIGKFQKAQTHTTVADFLGKVSGSTVANPHVYKRVSKNSLAVPTDNLWYEPTTLTYGFIDSSNATIDTLSTKVDGNQAELLFSFNVVEQVERQLGLIPKTTLAEKVQWVKDNVNSLTAKWNGFGSSVEGNKAKFDWWNGSGWVSSGTNNIGVHTSAIVARNMRILLSEHMPLGIDSNGFAHFLAYAEPSDGVTSSVINTDYINLEIELKSTAQLNTRGKIIRVENFEGKVSGSVVENPHKSFIGGANALLTPPNFGGTPESPTGVYGIISSLDGNSYRLTSVNKGAFAQHSFSFNLIEVIEQNIGKIPASDVVGKVLWLTKNVAKMTCNWWGYGSSPLGNAAKLRIYNKYTNGWDVFVGNYNNAPAKVTLTTVDTGYIGSDSFIHFIAFAEPTDGTIASIINTDYVELEIELKPDADFHTPKVPLYEITKEEYDKVGVVYSDAEVLNRYPVVEGTQHLVNPYVMAEGENLLPPFTEWSLSASTTVISPYRIQVDQPTGTFSNHVEIEVLPNTTYTLSLEKNVSGAYGNVSIFGSDGSSSWLFDISFSQSKTFTTKANSIKIRINLFNYNAFGIFEYSNLSLNLGSVAKPFMPRNPSYLYAETKLGQIGTTKDTLFKQDGQWKIKKATIDIDTTLLSTVLTPINKVGYKTLQVSKGNSATSVTFASMVSNMRGNFILLNPKGIVMSKKDFSFSNDGNQVEYDGWTLRINLLNSDTGWADAYSPTAQDLVRHFNGWKYTNGTSWISSTGNGQTATAQQALEIRPSDYSPYVMYGLSINPIIESVSVEGDISVEGNSQIEVGSGVIVREKVIPRLNGSSSLRRYLNYLPAISGNEGKTQFKALNIMAIYKNGKLDNTWEYHYYAIDTWSMRRASTLIENFDPTAEYTVTYLAEKPKLTTNIVDSKATYAKTFRSAQEELVGKVSDLATTSSVNVRAIAELYKQVKALQIK